MAKRARIKESITYADLAPSTSGTPVTLKLERTDGYYHGPTPITAREYSTASTKEVMGAMQRVQEETVATHSKNYQVRRMIFCCLDNVLEVQYKFRFYICNLLNALLKLFCNPGGFHKSKFLKLLFGHLTWFIDALHM